MAGPRFAEAVRRYRRQRNLTQEELAERSGLSVAAISLIERGQTAIPQRFTVQALSDALALTGDEADEFARLARAVRVPDRAERHVDPMPSLLPARRVHVPIPLTPLFGRERDIRAIEALLKDPAVRLVTLTGPAGVGKTRLALQVAANARAAAERAVVFVELIPIQEPERVLAAIAQALGIGLGGEQSLLEKLVRALRHRECVLVLDNFEQVLQAARPLLDVLMACPGVQALVTSRVALNVRGERCVPVAPLALPEAWASFSLEGLCRAPTVALFVDRAQAVAPEFTVGALDEAYLIAEICARLDGLPLAVELAAARIKHLGLPQLHERLAQPTLLGMLTDGPHDLADHQRTMRSTIAWSYALLSKEEQRLFRFLGVFVGGMSAEAIQTVTEMEEEALIAGLTALVDASLLQCVALERSRRLSNW